MMKLEEHLNQLPKHSVGVELWDNIDQRMSPDTTLIDKLPVHKANPELWYAIEGRLKKSTPFLLRLRYISVAASIAVIITLSTVYITHKDQGNLYYTEEIYIQDYNFESIRVQDVNFMENCNDYPAVCSTPDFTRLKSSLDQLKHEEMKLRDLNKSTNDPKMKLYHSRIVKNIQQVEAQMIQMFI